MEGTRIPDITFHYREGDAAPGDGGCAIGGEWVRKTTTDLFAGKRVLVFSLPGAYTPTCSTYQLPGFENNYFKILNHERYGKHIDEIYVAAVNDSFVMNAWAHQLQIENVKMLPDGNGEFCDSLGMLIDMSAVGFGKRSRRFAVVIDDGVVERAFVEPEATHNEPDPYGETSPENVMNYLGIAK
jgi:peroxiredoxin